MNIGKPWPLNGRRQPSAEEVPVRRRVVDRRALESPQLVEPPPLRESSDTSRSRRCSEASRRWPARSFRRRDARRRSRPSTTTTSPDRWAETRLARRFRRRPGSSVDRSPRRTPRSCAAAHRDQARPPRRSSGCSRARSNWACSGPRAVDHPETPADRPPWRSWLPSIP